MCGGCMPNQSFIAMVCDSESHAMILWNKIEYWSENNWVRNDIES